MEQWIGSVGYTAKWHDELFFFFFGVYRVLEKSSSYFLLHLKYIYNNDWLAIQRVE